MSDNRKKALWDPLATARICWKLLPRNACKVCIYGLIPETLTDNINIEQFFIEESAVIFFFFWYVITVFHVDYIIGCKSLHQNGMINKYPGSFQGTQSQLLGSFRQALPSGKAREIAMDRVPSMQVMWACVHVWNFRCIYFIDPYHVTGWNTFNKYTYCSPTIPYMYNHILLVKPVINAGFLEQIYPTIHRIERSLSSTTIPPPHPRYGLNKSYNWRRSDKLKETRM